MKYIVTAYVTEDKKYEANVVVKRNAKKRTVFIKCMNAVGQMLAKDKILTTGKYGFETPCLNNGCLGAAWFNDPFINVTIREETGAWIAL